MDISSTELAFFGDEREKLGIYLRLREIFCGMAPGCEVRVHKTTISFRAPRPFVYVSFPFRKHYKSWPEHHLLLSFSAPGPVDHPYVIQSTLIRPGLYTIHAVVLPPGDPAPGLMELIGQALIQRNIKEKT